MNGLLIQWGKQQANKKDVNDYTAIFNFVSFSTLPIVTFSTDARNMTSTNWIPAITELTSSRVKINLSVTNNASYNVWFIAIGY